MKEYKTAKLAISNLAGADKRLLKRMQSYGMEHDKIYAYGDRIFKVTSSRQEFLAAKRIIGKDFKNVVKMFSSFECDILSDDKTKLWRSYIVEEEKLNTVKFGFNDFHVCILNNNIKSRLPHFVSVVNGIIELASVGIKHNDLHTLNIMKDNEGVLKIIDFGFVSLKRKYDDISTRVFLK